MKAKLSLLLSSFVLAAACCASQGHRSSRLHSQNNKTPQAAGGGYNTYSIAPEVAETYIATDEDALECDGEDELTFCVWLKNNGTNAFIFSKTQSWRVFHFDSNDNVIFYIDSAGCTPATNYVQSGNDLTGDWHHVCGVFDGDAGPTNDDRIKLYVDGASSTGIDFGTVPATLDDCASNLTIAGPAGIDEAYVSCEALSAAQILDIYNSGSPEDSTSVFSDLRVHVRMGDAEGDSETTLVNSGAGGNFTSSTVDADDIVEDVP